MGSHHPRKTPSHHQRFLLPRFVLLVRFALEAAVIGGGAAVPNSDPPAAGAPKGLEAAAPPKGVAGVPPRAGTLPNGDGAAPIVGGVGVHAPPNNELAGACKQAR